MIFICDLSDVPEEGGLRVELPARPPVAVFRDQGQYFVLDDTCTHDHVSLADGEIIDGQIACPLHYGMFDLKTGEATASPCYIPLRTHDFTILNEKLYLNDSLRPVDDEPAL
jgi:nitrite reductase/ring-hydroxylating ferredoxin subunit